MSQHTLVLYLTGAASIWGEPLYHKQLPSTVYFEVQNFRRWIPFAFKDSLVVIIDNNGISVITSGKSAKSLTSKVSKYTVSIHKLLQWNSFERLE